MALEIPVWMRFNNYAPRMDRLPLEAMLAEGVIDPVTDLKVTQRAAGADKSVDVAVGICVIAGDDQADQGKYLCRNTAVYNVSVTANVSGDIRYDRIVAQINDPDAGGAAGSNWTIECLPGTPGAGVPPAVPDSAISLATIQLADGYATVTDGIITDTRTEYGFAEPWERIWTVTGTLALPSGATNYINDVPVFVPPGWSACVLSAVHKIRNGTSATVKVKRRTHGGAFADLTGWTGISVTTTDTTTTPSGTPIAIADKDFIVPEITAVSGSPDNLVFAVRGLRWRG